MAENLLGILLVTSSSRGRNVFRYPPDPLSPLSRLSQPIYPSATYTTVNLDTPPNRRQLFPPGVSNGRKQSATSSNGNGNGAARSKSSRDGGSSKGTGIRRDGFSTIQQDLESDGSETYDEDDTSLSEDSDYSYNWLSEGRRTAIKPAENGHLKVDDTRRGSIVSSSDLKSNKDKDESQEKKDGPDRFIEDQYNYALSYPIDFLSDMLTPPRSACNRKFEICVDELVFVGHPVSVGKDGNWGYPTEMEEADDDERSRGRGRRARDGGSHLGTVIEGKEGISGLPGQDGNKATATATATGRNGDETPTLNMFHLVLVFDKPDPHPGATVMESLAPLNMFDEVYREVAFKWTAAAYALQVQENFIAREVYVMAQFREKCIHDGIPISQCSPLMVEKSPLERSLWNLLLALHGLKKRPLNPLYSNLPTTITVNLGDMPVSMIISPRSSETDEAWAHWGEAQDGSDSEDDESEMDWEDGIGPMPSMRPSDLRVEPWQTLLLLDDNARDRAHQISTDLIGVGGAEGYEEGERVDGEVDTSRRGSVEEEDERSLMKSLIEACDVTKPLADIAHILRCDLDGIIIPLARELVENRKAILIDIVNIRLRTTVMPTTIAEHELSLEDYSSQFAQRFSSFPPLPAFISMISSSPTHFRDLLPPEAQNNNSLRQKYMDALIWLLKQDLVVQAHLRARVFASPEIKSQAWLKLWKRRRERWLNVRTEQPLDQSTSDLVTPRAVEHQLNPLETAPTVPEPKGMGMDQSFMDYDPDLEMDSDLGEGEMASQYEDFSVDMVEPRSGEVPKFVGSFIFKPARASKDEARWLRVIREGADEVWASKFDLCVQYFDGMTTFEEIAYRTGLPRRELEKLLNLFKDNLVTFLHP